MLRSANGDGQNRRSVLMQSLGAKDFAQWQRLVASVLTRNYVGDWRDTLVRSIARCVDFFLGYSALDLRKTAIALVLLSSGCLAADDIDTTFDPCSPLTIAVRFDTSDIDTSDDELQSVDAAIASWAQVLPTRIARVREEESRGEEGRDEENSDGLKIVFESGDSFYRAIYFDKRGEILVNRGSLTLDEMPLAIAHELGHAFGLLHVAASERRSVMNVGNLDIAPDSEDASNVSALWDACSATTAEAN
jgi:hypothetical protein